MDNKMLDLIEMNCWDEIVTKFCSMYPFIADKEKRRIPDVLLQYVEVEKQQNPGLTQPPLYLPKNKKIWQT